MASLPFEFEADASGMVSALREVQRESRRQTRLMEEQNRGVKKLNSASAELWRSMKRGMLELPWKALSAGFSGLSRSVRGFWGYSIDASRKQEMATRRLTTALEAANVPVREGMDFLGKFNRRLQDTTNVGDDVAQSLQTAFLPLLEGPWEQKLRQAARLSSLAADLQAQSGQSLSTVQRTLQNVVGKRSYDRLSQFGLTMGEMERARAMDAAGEDGRRFVLNRLAQKSAGAAARERELNPGAAAMNEVGDIVENVGGLLLEMRNNAIKPLIEPLRRINLALEGSDLVATGKRLLDMFGSGELANVFGPTIDLAKQVAGDLLSGLQNVLAAGWEALREIMRYGGLQIEDGIVAALRNVPGFGGLESRLEKSTKRQQQLVTQIVGNAYMGGTLGTGVSAEDRRSMIRQVMMGKPGPELREYHAALKRGEDPMAAALALADARGDKRGAQLREEMGRGALDMGRAKRRLGAAGSALGRAYQGVSAAPATVLEDAATAAESAAVPKQGPAMVAAGAMAALGEAYKQRLATQYPGGRL